MQEVANPWIGNWTRWNGNWTAQILLESIIVVTGTFHAVVEGNYYQKSWLYIILYQKYIFNLFGIYTMRFTVIISNNTHMAMHVAQLGSFCSQ